MVRSELTFHGIVLVGGIMLGLLASIPLFYVHNT